jgi:hypothetical protein
VDWIDLAGYRAGSCENDCELSGSLKCEVFIDLWRNRLVHEKDYSPYS